MSTFVRIFITFNILLFLSSSFAEINNDFPKINQNLTAKQKKEFEIAMKEVKELAQRGLLTGDTSEDIKLIGLFVANLKKEEEILQECLKIEESPDKNKHVERLEYLQSEWVKLRETIYSQHNKIGYQIACNKIYVRDTYNTTTQTNH